jgi:hypothetical protein
VDEATEDAAIQQAILQLLGERRGSICPSEAARLVDPVGWRQRMDAVRATAARMAAEGTIRWTQRGEPQSPDAVRGPVRFERAP